MTATIHELRWGDADDLIEIFLHLYEERAAGEPIGISLYDQPPSQPSEIDWFSSLYRRELEGAAMTRVAELHGHAIGSCTVTPGGHGKNTEMGHVGALGVLLHWKHRNQGIGRLLLSDVIERCRSNYETLRLSVFSNNAHAIRLYERLGFVRCGLLPRAIRRGSTYYDSLEMFLSL